MGEIEGGVILNMQFQNIFSFSFSLIANDKIRRQKPASPAEMTA